MADMLSLVLGSSGNNDSDVRAYLNVTNITGDVTDVVIANDITGVQVLPPPVIKGPSGSMHEPPREFPLALVVASVVAAVFILLLFLFTYCWHARQLDRRARKLAIRMAADAEEGMRKAGAGPRRSRGRRASRAMPKRSLSNVPLPAHPSVAPKRNSADTDQEVLRHAPRRHSTFFI